MRIVATVILIAAYYLRVIRGKLHNDSFIFPFPNFKTVGTIPATSDSRPHLNPNTRPRTSFKELRNAIGEAMIFFALAYGSILLGTVGLCVATIVLALRDSSSKVMVNEAYMHYFNFFNHGYVWQG